MKLLTNAWYSKSRWPILLIPFSYLYLLGLKLHQFIYKSGLKKVFHSPVPVVGVGNITVGGTGKTPFVIELAKVLIQAGYKPGIVSRGYKGKVKNKPCVVNDNSDPALVGDEPILLAQKTQCPVIVSPKRSLAVKKLIVDYSCDVILSDDGLQHYALHKDLEIMLMDAQRQYGNGYCLPAGPLREPLSRLKRVNFLVANGLTAVHDYSIFLRNDHIYNLTNDRLKFVPSYYRDKKIHAVAGIGHPQRFFNGLRSIGLTVIEHSFPDHHSFRQSDFCKFSEDDIIVMTEKDAVKCRNFARKNWWALAVNTVISESFLRDFLVRIKDISIQKAC